MHINPTRFLRLVLLVLALLGTGISAYRPDLLRYAINPLRALSPRSVADVLETYGPAAEARLKPHFERADVAYPPPRITLVAYKREKRLELWVPRGDTWAHIHDYPIRAASGGPGPKLREGDLQVPEGIYRIEYLNPNSSFHLSMKIDYPNAFDREQARADARTNPGGDIFIHGRAASIGCLAMGDPAIEELFVLAATIGYDKIQVLIAPTEKLAEFVPDAKLPSWTPRLYGHLRQALKPFLKFRSAEF